MDVRRLKDDELYHHGVKGQRWGIRRYQNPDGSLTPAGMARYAEKTNKEFAKARKDYLDANKLARKGRVEIDNDVEYKFYDESNAFDKIVDESGIKYDSDTLDLGIGQIYLLNRGINPNTYAKQLKAKQEKYEQMVREYRTIPVTDTPNILGEKMTHESIYLMDTKDDAGLWDYDGLKGAYAEDDEIFERLAKTAKKHLDKNGEPIIKKTRGIRGQEWGNRKK